MQVLFHAHITTLNPDQPQASALAVDQGYILAVGSDEQILARYGQRAEKIDLHDQTVWPGLTDAHLHLGTYALSLERVDCETDTRAECIQRVAGRAHQTPHGEWVRGHGWNQNVWTEGFGTAADLDERIPDHPVYLTAKSLHAAWANSLALQRAGIHAGTPDPQDGKIVRDASGQPTGILLEGAVRLVEDILPAPSLASLAKAIQNAQTVLWQMGLTGVHDYDPSECFSALQILDQSGELGLRTVKSIPLDRLPSAVEIGLRSGFGSPHLRIGSVKLFADGALGPHTAAMLSEYDDAPSSGILFLDRENVFEIGQQAVTNGISLAVHAIGDRANHEVIQGIAQLREFETQQHLPHLRHRIEHVQALHPSDFNRLAELGIIASVQPIHATSDMFIADRSWGARSVGAYAYRTLLESGAHLAFGSDAPVESPNPFLGLHAAVTRCRADGTAGPDGWYPAQRLSLMEALHGYTTGAAYACGQENRLGRLAPGYCADLIVLPDDPFELPPAELHHIHPAAVMLAGRWVWQNG